MNGLDAIETINSWQQLVIDGSAERIDQMLDDVGRRLAERGWARDPGMESKADTSASPKIQRRFFVGGPENGPRVRLGLSRVSDRRVRGESYSLLDGPAGMETSDVARVVEDVIADVMTPPIMPCYGGSMVTNPEAVRWPEKQRSRSLITKLGMFFLSGAISTRRR
jgi:hypothetical protein